MSAILVAAVGLNFNVPSGKTSVGLLGNSHLMDYLPALGPAPGSSAVLVVTETWRLRSREV